MRTTPPRADACSPTRTSRPSRRPQYSARVQWADPVTGSSGTPALGAKARLTQSMPGRSPGALRIRRRVPVAAIPLRSGWNRRTRPASATTANASDLPTPYQTSPGNSSAAGGSTSTGRSAGKSISIQPSADIVQPSGTAPGVEPGRTAEDMGGGQGGVPTEVDLGGRREPPQVVIAVRPRDDEGGLGEVHLPRHRLHEGVVREGVDQGHGGRVAGERHVREGVDRGELEEHGTSGPTRWRLRRTASAARAPVRPATPCTARRTRWGGGT